ncbi:MAG: nickel pincer cofactor biosynthesis protein LarC [Clostridiales bacterium]|nr:nickel pincer cofactor biosynthesis protein LarC [Clostridiales bacterium]
MTLIYFDCFAGASGDMLLAALLDAGAPLDTVRAELAKLPIRGFTLETTRVMKRGLSALDVTVNVEEKDQPHRHFRDIENLLLNSNLSPAVGEMSLAVFTRLAAAEGKIHNKPTKDVHFHEVGAVDSIVDIVGIAAALHALGATAIHASPVHVGTGFVQCAHGLLPVPAPATMELLQGVPVYSRGIEAELLTPTGAAVLAQLAQFGPLPPMRIKSTGYGAGKKDLAIANLLRVIVGENDIRESALPQEDVIVLEANIDDMNPEFYGHVMEMLFAADVLDVYLSPLQMKKNRPAVLLRVLVRPQQEKEALTILLRETTTLGVRRFQGEKIMLPRKHVTVQTPYGSARVKVAELGGTEINAVPEYEDCLKLAKAHNIPLKEIYLTVSETYRQTRGQV